MAAGSGRSKAAGLWELDARPACASLPRTPPCRNTAGPEQYRPPESFVPVAPFGFFAPYMRSCSMLMHHVAASGSPSLVPTPQRCGPTLMSHEASSKRFYSQCWGATTTRLPQPAGKGMACKSPIFLRRTASKFQITCRRELGPFKNGLRAASTARKILSSTCCNEQALSRRRVHCRGWLCSSVATNRAAKRKINLHPHLRALTATHRRPIHLLLICQYFNFNFKR